MKNLFVMLDQNGIFHWIVGVLGIFALVFVKLIKVKNFSMQRWVNENIIGFIWSVFILSLVVTLLHEYLPIYDHIEAFLTSYCGAHIIFRIHKKHDHTKKYNLKKTSHELT